jgi:hypothetical protein
MMGDLFSSGACIMKGPAMIIFNVFSNAIRSSEKRFFSLLKRQGVIPDTPKQAFFRLTHILPQPTLSFASQKRTKAFLQLEGYCPV